jgi:hypothetical protein
MKRQNCPGNREIMRRAGKPNGSKSSRGKSPSKCTEVPGNADQREQADTPARRAQERGEERARFRDSG